MSANARRPVIAALVLGLSATVAWSAAPPGNRAAAPAYRLSGPFTHENLTIFFLHGPDQIKGRKLLTLDEALAQKKVIVHETKNVNQLSIENVSAEEVFVQAGDIVRGGQQDRTIAVDLIVPPRSGKLPVGSFCVEQSRWGQRGGEAVTVFNSSRNQLADNRTKLAARKSASQRLVWLQVQDAQKKLSANLKTEVKDARSQTSYELTLSHRKVLEAVDAYVKRLQGSLDRQTDVIGYAVAINGKVNNADVYANADLFRRLWPKLLHSSVVEAVAERKDGVRVAPVKAEAVTGFLNEANRGKESNKEVAGGLREVQKETERNILFETRGFNATVIRRSYLAK